MPGHLLADGSTGDFGAVGIQILAGRDFDADDVRPRPMVMAINDTFGPCIRVEDGYSLRSATIGSIRVARRAGT